MSWLAKSVRVASYHMFPVLCRLMKSALAKVLVAKQLTSKEKNVSIVLTRLMTVSLVRLGKT